MPPLLNDCAQIVTFHSLDDVSNYFFLLLAEKKAITSNLHANSRVWFEVDLGLLFSVICNICGSSWLGRLLFDSLQRPLQCLHSIVQIPWSNHNLPSSDNRLSSIVHSVSAGQPISVQNGTKPEGTPPSYFSWKGATLFTRSVFHRDPFLVNGLWVAEKLSWQFHPNPNLPVYCHTINWFRRKSRVCDLLSRL